MCCSSRRNVIVNAAELVAQHEDIVTYKNSRECARRYEFLSTATGNFNAITLDHMQRFSNDAKCVDDLEDSKSETEGKI